MMEQLTASPADKFKCIKNGWILKKRPIPTVIKKITVMWELP